MQILKKLTISTLGHSKGAINAALKPLVDAHDAAIVKAKADNNAAEVARLEGVTITYDLAKIVGKSTAAQPGQSATGDYIKFVGSFMSVDCHSGEMMQSSICILPQFIALTLHDALKESDSVEFALMVFAQYDAKSVTGYRFGVRSLMPPKVTNAMAALLSMAGVQDVAALTNQAPAPAPTPEPALEIPPAPEPAAPTKGKGK